MSCCGVISRISIDVTFTPQRIVSVAILVCRRVLISSRRASTSSTVMSPITARSEVVARLRTAMMKLLMLITAASASTTCRKTTKSTSTSALSLVIEVCFGSSITNSRISTRTPRSMKGTMITRPGPRVPT